MASTFYDATTGYFTRKFKGLTGKYQRIKLGKPEPTSDPQIIPQHIHNLANQYQDFGHNPEFNAPRQLSPTSPEFIVLDKKLESFFKLQAQICQPLTIHKLRMVIGDFKKWCKSKNIVYLHEVKPSTAQSYVEHLMERGTLAPQSIKGNLSLLGKLWSQAIRLEQYVGQNPIRAVLHDLPSSDSSDPPEILTEAEIVELLAEIAWRKSRPFKSGPSSQLPQWVEDIVNIMLNTGMRVNAAGHLEFKWVEENKITIPKSYSKSKKAYSTFANKKVTTIIARRRKEVSGDRVFPEFKGSSCLYSRLKYLVKSLIRKGKWKRDHGHYSHILRHTFITETLKQGVPLIMVSKLAGHTTTRMTERYDHTTCDDAIKWAVDTGIEL